MQTWHLEQLKTERSLPHDGLGLWLPTELTSIHRIGKPSAPRRKWQTMLPWLVEDRVLDAVDKMHFTLLEADADTLTVLAITTSDLDAALAQADKSGVMVLSVQPDFLALPWQAGEITVAWRLTEKGRVLLVRTAGREGFAVPEQLAEAMLRSKSEKADAPCRIRALMPEEALPGFLDAADVICDEAPDWHAPLAENLNLLHGDYVVNTGKPVNTMAGWATAALLMLSTVLFYSWLRLDNSVLEREVVQLDQTLQQQFNRSFPGIGLIENDVRATLESVQRDRSLQREKLQEPLAALMLNLDPVLAACNCRLTALELTGNNATLDFSGEVLAPAFNVLNGYSATTAVTEPGKTRVTLRRSQP